MELDKICPMTGLPVRIAVVSVTNDGKWMELTFKDHKIPHSYAHVPSSRYQHISNGDVVQYTRVSVHHAYPDQVDMFHTKIRRDRDFAKKQRNNYIRKLTEHKNSPFIGRVKTHLAESEKKYAYLKDISQQIFDYKTKCFLNGSIPWPRYTVLSDRIYEVMQGLEDLALEKGYEPNYITIDFNQTSVPREIEEGRYKPQVSFGSWLEMLLGERFKTYSEDKLYYPHSITGSHLFADYLGFGHMNNLSYYMKQNPALWGGSFGDKMFCSPVAYNVSNEETLHLTDITNHWRMVADRIGHTIKTSF